MKNVKISLFAIGLSIMSVSCNKEECHECHYDQVENGITTEVELGLKCDDELKAVEANGYTDAAGNNYEVHCHEH
jgi:hypothetical protein